MQKIVGIISIICGSILVATVVIPLLVPVALFIIGLIAINYGLRVLHYPNIWRSAQMLIWRRRF